MSKTAGSSGSSKKTSSAPKMVKTEELKPKGYEGSCLRPLGLCDLGGCCEVCWYGSANKRTRESSTPAEDN